MILDLEVGSRVEPVILGVERRPLRRLRDVTDRVGIGRDLGLEDVDLRGEMA